MLHKLAIALSALVAVSVAQAHNVWLEPVKNEAQNYVVKFGHEETESYPEHKLVSVQLLDEKGTLSSAQYQFKNGEAYFNAGKSVMAFVKFDNGVWSKLPSGKYVEKTKQQAPEAEFSMNPLKFGKAILAWNDEAYQPQKMEYELVPLQKAEANRPLDILVLHNGKPVENIKVGVGEDAPFNLTNAQGIAQFTPKKGENRVWAEFEEKVSGNPDYSERSIEYMLTFDAN